jgi:hypothetical protein
LKKFAAIIFIFLCLFFCGREFVILSCSLSAAPEYILDLNEEELTEEDENSDNRENHNSAMKHQQVHRALLAFYLAVSHGFEILEIEKCFNSELAVFSPPPEKINHPRP